MLKKMNPALQRENAKFLVLLHMFEGARQLLKEPEFLSAELQKSCETIVAQYELFRDMRKQIDDINTLLAKGRSVPADIKAVLPELKKHTETFLKKNGIPPTIAHADFTPARNYHRKIKSRP